MPRVEKTIALPLAAIDGGRLDVRMDRGVLRIRSGEPGASRLEVHLRGEAGSPAEAQALVDGFSPEISAQEGHVRIEVECGPADSSGWLFWKRRREKRLEAEVTVTVPLRQDLNLSLRAGSLQVEAAEGTVAAAVEAGDLHLGVVTGDASARVESGLIEIGRVSGRLTARTAVGGVHVEEAGEALEITTSAGDIVTRVLHPLREDSRLTTVVGQIRVKLDEKVGADVEARTETGRVLSEYPLGDGRESGGGLQRGAVNGGGRKLTLSSKSGQISVGRLAPA